MKCFACNQELPDDSAFCNKCGARMRDVTVLAAASQEVKTPAPEAPATGFGPASVPVSAYQAAPAQAVYTPASTQYPYGQQGYAHPTITKKSKKPLIFASMSILAVALIVVLLVSLLGGVGNRGLFDDSVENLELFYDSKNAIGGSLIAQSEDWLYFIDEDIYLARCKMNGSERETLLDTGAFSLALTSNYLYYINVNDSFVYRMLHDGTQSELIVAEHTAWITIVDDRLLCLEGQLDDGNRQTLVSRTLNGDNRTKLYTGYIRCINVVDETIFFNEYREGKIISIGMDGSGERVECYFDGDDIYYFVMLNGSIYYYSYEGTIVRRDLQTGKTEVLMMVEYDNPVINIYNGQVVICERADKYSEEARMHFYDPRSEKMTQVLQMNLDNFDWYMEENCFYVIGDYAYLGLGNYLRINLKTFAVEEFY